MVVGSWTFLWGAFLWGGCCVWQHSGVHPDTVGVQVYLWIKFTAVWLTLGIIASGGLDKSDLSRLVDLAEVRLVVFVLRALGCAMPSPLPVPRCMRCGHAESRLVWGVLRYPWLSSPCPALAAGWQATQLLPPLVEHVF